MSIAGEKKLEASYHETRKRASVGSKKVVHTSYLHLDGIIHEKTRLAIISVLLTYGSVSFRELKDLLGISDGNLSVHARRLEQAGYLICDKRFDGRVPRTEYSLTESGSRALVEYVECIEPIIQSIRNNSIAC